MTNEYRADIQEYIRASEVVLKLDLSKHEELAVAEVLVRVAEKLYPE